MADKSARDTASLRRVLVITGDHELPDPSKWDGCYSAADLDLHRQMRVALESLPGYRFEFLSRHADLIPRLLRDPPELVLNLCDTGFCNQDTQELHVPALLEAFGIPYTGAPPASMVLCYDKAIVRLVAESCGVPTPREVYVAPDSPLDRIEASYPALIKPARGDGSVGINRNAVVRSAEEAARQLRWFRCQFPGAAALIQEYLPGPEYGLALIGNPGRMEALPLIEVDFSALPAGLPPILAFESKTGPDTPYDAVRVRPAKLSSDCLAAIRRHTETLFARLECRDYARFDFRAGADGTIRLLEVNPNPAWSSAAKLALMAGFAGKSYPELLGMILTAAETRLTVRENPEDDAEKGT